MNTRAFPEWIGSLALVAALLLMAMPATTRLVHASADVGHAGTAHGAAANGHDGHDGPAAGIDRSRREPHPAPRGADCDYCPLLGSLLELPGPAFEPAAAPALPTVVVAPSAPGVARLHPNGLGSRGPPVAD